MGRVAITAGTVEMLSMVPAAQSADSRIERSCCRRVVLPPDLLYRGLPIQHAALSPDASIVAAASGKFVTLWQPASGRLVKVLPRRITSNTSSLLARRIYSWRLQSSHTCGIFSPPRSCGQQTMMLSIPCSLDGNATTSWLPFCADPRAGLVQAHQSCGATGSDLRSMWVWPNPSSVDSIAFCMRQRHPILWRRFREGFILPLLALLNETCSGDVASGKGMLVEDEAVASARSSRFSDCFSPLGAKRRERLPRLPPPCAKDCKIRRRKFLLCLTPSRTGQHLLQRC